MARGRGAPGMARGRGVGGLHGHSACPLMGRASDGHVSRCGGFAVSSLDCETPVGFQVAPQVAIAAGAIHCQQRGLGTRDPGGASHIEIVARVVPPEPINAE